MMLATPFTALVLLTLPLPVASTESDPRDPREEAWKTVEEWNRAFAANDAERYFSFVDLEISVLTPGNPYRVEGLRDDREEFEFGVRSGKARVSYFQVAQPRVQVFGDVAVVTYFSRGAYGPEAKTAYLKETDVLVKRPSGWRIAHVHVSATTP
jgi:ketosteroid isomerase-like protein